MKKILLYIVYGDNQGYYDDAKYSLLTFMNWIQPNDPIDIVVLTEKPEEFERYPITALPLSTQQKDDWSLNGKYHFRIKNRGLAYVMDKMNLSNNDKILFLDTDTYFHKSPLSLFNFIQPKQALFYLNEGLIYDRKRFDVYIKHLEGKVIEIENVSYQLSKKSAMWGSLMVGIMPNMRPSLDWSDKLMLKFIDMVPAHTIEPFSLSETLLKKYTIAEGKHLVSLYSTSGKKAYAVKILKNFFEKNKDNNIKEQVSVAQKIRLKRPIYFILKQRFEKIFNKE